MTTLNFLLKIARWEMLLLQGQERAIQETPRFWFCSMDNVKSKISTILII